MKTLMITLALAVTTSTAVAGTPAAPQTAQVRAQISHVKPTINSAQFAKQQLIKAATARKIAEQQKAQRIAQQRAAAQRVAQQRAVAQRVAQQRAAAQRVAQQRAVAQRVAQQRAAAQRVAQQRAAAQRAAQQRAAAQRVAQQRAAAQRVAQQRTTQLAQRTNRPAITPRPGQTVSNNRVAR